MECRKFELEPIDDRSLFLVWFSGRESNTMSAGNMVYF